MANSVQTWLNELLRERLSKEFRLKIDGGRWVLHVPGNEGRIEFPRFGWPSGDSTLPVRWFRPDDEEWKPSSLGPLPLVGVDSVGGQVVSRVANNYIVRFDFPGFLGWILTRQEELNRSDLDDHNRFTSQSSHAWRHGYLHRPVVDEWMEFIKQVAKRLWPGLALINDEFRIYLSHDIDRPSRYALQSFGSMAKAVLGDVYRRRHPAPLLQGPLIRVRSREKLDKQDPFNTFEFIMSESERRDLASEFFLVCSRGSNPLDPQYSVSHRPIRDLVKRAANRGHRIGLHGSYDSFQTDHLMRVEADTLRQLLSDMEIRQDGLSGRMHYLRWQMPDTLRSYERAGLDCDNTLGYSDYPGFRSGTCFDYPAFDPIEERRIKVRIRPLIAMDATLLEKRPDLWPDVASMTKTLINLKSSCAAVGGTFSLLWHNCRLRHEWQRAVYREVLDG